MPYQSCLVAPLGIVGGVLFGERSGVIR